MIAVSLAASMLYGVFMLVMIVAILSRGREDD
jgi:hypothetical protein